MVFHNYSIIVVKLKVVYKNFNFIIYNIYTRSYEKSVIYWK